GGAVYINHAVLKNKHWDALVSAAGPLANLIFLLLLCVPFLLDWPNDDIGNHVFWGALGFLAALQASAVVLNLLPIPGLDGFGIIRPYLPYDMQAQADQVASILDFFLIVIFMSDQVSGAIWRAVFTITKGLGIVPPYIYHGMKLFRFWY